MAKVTVELVKEISSKDLIKPQEKCDEKMTGDKAETFYKEVDKKGNTFEIKCDGQLLGVFTPKGGKPVYVGKCIYPYGHNAIRKKVLTTAEVKVRADGQIGWTLGPKDPDYITPDEMETITWKNIKPEGDPPETGKKGDIGPEVTGGKDILWIYDVKANTYVTQKTQHKGHWRKDGDGKDDWVWDVVEQAKDGKESDSKAAPTDKKDLSVAGVITEHNRGACAVNPPSEFAAYTPVPFTVLIGDDLQTYVARLAATAEEFAFERIEAAAGQPFSFQVVMPHQEEQVIAYRLQEAPATMTIDAATGLIRWTPGEADIGNHTVVVEHAYSGLSPHRDQFVLRVGLPASISHVSNGASFGGIISAGSWVTIQGSNLSRTSRTWRSSDIVDGALPTALDGVSVRVGGRPAYISFVSPTQINAQAPSDLKPGPVSVQVINNGTTSSAVPVSWQIASPAFFQWGKYVVATRTDFSFVAPPDLFPGVTTTPARPGEVIILWGTGFGPTDPIVPAGVLSPSSVVAHVTNPVRLRIGDEFVAPLSTVLSPANAGLYQIAVRIPDTIADGDQPVVAEILGFSSPANVLLRIQR